MRRIFNICAVVIFLFGFSVEAQSFKLSGFVIGRYRLDETSSPDKALQDVQNAKLKLAGELGKNLRFTVQHDFAPNNWQGLLNVASLAWDWNAFSAITLGKQFIPFGLENDIGSYGLKTANFSNIYSLLMLPLFVDNAVMVSVNTDPARKFWFTALQGDAAVAGIAGSPQVLDYAVRYQQTLTRDGLRVVPGISLFYGEDGAEKKVNGELNITDGTTEAQGEVLWGETAGKTSYGAYLLAARKVFPWLEPAFKYDYYEPDSGIAGNETNTYTAALNLYWVNIYRLQTVYQVIDETGTELTNNRLLVRLSVKI